MEKTTVYGFIANELIIVLKGFYKEIIKDPNLIKKAFLELKEKTRTQPTPEEIADYVVQSFRDALKYALEYKGEE